MEDDPEISVASRTLYLRNEEPRDLTRLFPRLDSIGYPHCSAMKGTRNTLALSRSAKFRSLATEARLRTPAKRPDGSHHHGLVRHSVIQLPLSSLLSREFASGLTPPVDATKTSPLVVMESDALSYAAQEAQRLLLLPSRTKPSTTLNNDSAACALDASNNLLLVTQPSSLLVKTILQKRSPSETATLHRAFLDISSWCLDHVEDENLDLEKRAALLEVAFALGRRAHELTLPLHIPLYQRLMEALAKGQHTAILGPPVQLILEVSSWVASTLDAPMDARLFRTCLCRLIEDRRLDEANELFTGMRVRHGINSMDFVASVEILVLLRACIRDAPQHLPNQLEAASSMTSHLETFVLKPFLGKDATPSNMYEKLQALEKHISPAKMEELLDQLITQAESSLSDDEDDDDLSDWSDDDEVGRDQLDIAAQRLLAKGVRNWKVRTMLTDLMRKYHAKEAVRMTSPQMQVVESFTGGESKNTDYETVGVDGGEGDTDKSEAVWRMQPDELIYVRGRRDLPDVTAQFVSANGGQEMLFTREFEEILWFRDFEEDVAFFESMRQTPDSDSDSDSEENVETDFSDDDSDDEY